MSPTTHIKLYFLNTSTGSYTKQLSDFQCLQNQWIQSINLCHRHINRRAQQFIQKFFDKHHRKIPSRSCDTHGG